MRSYALKQIILLVAQIILAGISLYLCIKNYQLVPVDNPLVMDKSLAWAGVCGLISGFAISQLFDLIESTRDT